MRYKGMANLGLVFLIAITLLAGRLIYLMLINDEQLAGLVQAQQQRSLDYHQYARGDIIDNNGRLLTSVEEAAVVVFPLLVDDLAQTALSLSKALDLDYDLVHLRLKQGNQQLISPYIFKTGLSSSQLKAVDDLNLGGIMLFNLAARYGVANLAPHIVGMVQSGANAGQVNGVLGIEAQYDSYLNQRDDTKIMTYVDAVGKPSTDQWLLVEPKQNIFNSVQLTINSDFQQIAERALGDLSGACLILDAQNGDILAAASAPKFDPYSWQPAADEAYINKAFSYYNPASTFKILLAIAALETGLSLDNFNCTGSTLIDDSHQLNCWYGPGHGEQDLAQALANSCNPYFSQLGFKLGADTIKHYAGLLGLNWQNIGGYQIAGQYPFDFNPYVAGDMANISIGENGISLSPLLVAQMVATVANGGYLVEPRLVSRVINQDGDTLLSIESQEKTPVISGNSAKQVADMMHLVISEGTLSKLADCLIPVAAKTGTSEVGGVWCAGFAPYSSYTLQKARWSIAVFIEDGQAGSIEAAEVFKQVIDDIALLEGMV